MNDLKIRTARNDHGRRSARGDSNAGNPLTVSVVLTLHRVLAFSESVPEFYSLVSRSTDDLSVIGTESDREDVFTMTDESSCGLSRVEIPQTKGRIPRSAEAELSVDTDDNIRHEMGVAYERFLRDSEGLLVVSFISEVPYENGLISGCTDNQISVVIGGCNGGYPTSVTFEFSSCYKMFGHVIIR